MLAPVSVPLVLEPVVPDAEVEVSVLVVPLVLVLPIVEPVLFVVAEFVVPVVPLVALGLVVLLPGPGVAVLLPVVALLSVPVVEPVDCACVKPAAANSEAAAAATARLFEIWFMV
ncbi:MAG: hypothetical protein AB1430_22090 [Pseudomonadota bacterium]